MNDTEIFEICDELGVQFQHCWKNGFTVSFEGEDLDVSRIRLSSKAEAIYRILLAVRASGYKSGRNDLKIDIKNLLSVESDQ